MYFFGGRHLPKSSKLKKGSIVSEDRTVRRNKIKYVWASGWPASGALGPDWAGYRVPNPSGQQPVCICSPSVYSSITSAAGSKRACLRISYDLRAPQKNRNCKSKHLFISTQLLSPLEGQWLYTAAYSDIIQGFNWTLHANYLLPQAHSVKNTKSAQWCIRGVWLWRDLCWFAYTLTLEAWLCLILNKPGFISAQGPDPFKTIIGLELPSSRFQTENLISRLWSRLEIHSEQLCLGPGERVPQTWC